MTLAASHLPFTGYGDAWQSGLVLYSAILASTIAYGVRRCVKDRFGR